MVVHPPARNSDEAGSVVPNDEVCGVPIQTIASADSPRLDGINEQHVTLLAECLHELPPILIHRQTMRVIDGMHRLYAAIRAGHDTVAARFFDGSEEEAFARAVEINVQHGLHLPLADRKAAAQRVLAAFPGLSDRAIAVKTGLSDKTVAVIRRGRADAQRSEHESRVGQDGHSYPTDSAERRERVAQLIAKWPDASLRTIAAAAGVSPGTVSKVKKRLSAEATLARAPRSVEAGVKLPPGPDARVRLLNTEQPDHLAVMDKLRRDPSLRDREAGRELLRWLSRHLIKAGEPPDVSMIPPHCLTSIAQLAQQTATTWLAFAQSVEATASEYGVSLRTG
ncbi:ParB/RepB/Spo0J family partition protein [Nonomuraea fuscirosea]|uniref:ParB/RepB/Spo0J family partition protein n=1 Tax=Nonomuraea fuscirosea TaxID=1291556 RepID=UPI00343068F7